MRKVIYWRTKDFEKEELETAQQYFFCTPSLLDLRPDDVVIPRYSFLPFGKELCDEFKKIGCHVLNDYSEHRYIADLREWYEDLSEFTPKTWFNLHEIPDEGPFFLKGETNSKKFLWDTHAFARNKKEAVEVYGRLLDDNLTGTQNIYIREFEEFETYCIAPHGLPITNEWRCFVANNEIISTGYYWASHLDEWLERTPGINHSRVPEDGMEFLKLIVDKLYEVGRANGYCIDIAKRKDGVWRLVELNDLQMSGLSQNNADIFYRELYHAV